MTLLEITHSERARWQRRAAAELASILQVHEDLPVIAWTVGPAGSTLVGNASSAAPAHQVRAVFASWRSALKLEDFTETISGSGSSFLRAVRRRNRVQVALIASVSGDEPGVSG